VVLINPALSVLAIVCRSCRKKCTWKTRSISCSRTFPWGRRPRPTGGSGDVHGYLSTPLATAMKAQCDDVPGSPTTDQADVNQGDVGVSSMRVMEPGREKGYVSGMCKWCEAGMLVLFSLSDPHQ
jgi:hypothetical protein